MKTLTLNVSAELYEALERLAACVNTTVEEFAQLHLNVLVNDAPTAKVIESRLNINRAIEKALSYDTGTIFNAKEIMPLDLEVSAFQGYSRHIHGALQKNGNFTKIIEIPSGLTKYRRN